jgi:hypothetical protein
LLVIDEVHASDAYMAAIVSELVDAHLNAGGYVLLMSATLGETMAARLTRRPRLPVSTATCRKYPLVSSGTVSATPVSTRSKTACVKIERHVDCIQHAMQAVRSGKTVLWIRSTVTDALHDYRLFQAANIPAMLHHSRYADIDRQFLDGEVTDCIGIGGTRTPSVIVATQTCEQSLDIDADILITDAVPADVMLQRMGRAGRHRVSRYTADVAAAIACHVLRGRGSAPHLLVGPTVRISGTSPRHCHFMAAGADADGTFRVDQIAADDRDEAERLRAAVIAVLAQRPPIVVIDLDDELEMARLCEALWSSERTRSIRARIELERAAPAVSHDRRTAHLHRAERHRVRAERLQLRAERHQLRAECHRLRAERLHRQRRGRAGRCRMTDTERDELRNRLRSDGSLLRSFVDRRVKLKKAGQVWKGCCPFHNEKTASFTVYDGADPHYHCFGCAVHGDVFEYVMKTESVDFSEALRRVAEVAGTPLPKPKPNGPEPSVDNTWEPMVPPPADAVKPTDAQLRCDVLHEYCGPDDLILFYVKRFEANREKGKYFVPLTFGRLNGKLGWHQKAPNTPRPLYGLNRLSHGRPDAIVLLCEGEKSGDAAQRLFPDYIALSWMGGTGGVETADYTPLNDRRIVIWPDADDPGGEAAKKLHKLLPLAQVIDTTDLSKGYDAADLEHAGVDDPEAWLKERLLQPPNDILRSELPVLEGFHQIPHRPWAYGYFLMFGQAAVIGALDGTGKGFLATAMILAFVTCKPLLGERIWRQGPVGIITYEDDETEWLRRIAAACMHYGIDYNDIRPHIFFLFREDRRIAIAAQTQNRIVYPDSVGIIARLKQERAAGLFVDPFNAAHEIDDGNSNVLIARVAMETIRIARGADVTAVVLHHLRKGATGDVDDLMGATSLRASFRACRILSRMTGEDAAKLGIDERERRRYFRIASTKENYAPPPDEAVWFKLESIDLGNPTEIYPEGDNVAIVVRWTPPRMFEGMSDAELRAVFAALEANPDAPDKRGGKPTKPDSKQRQGNTQATALPWAGQPLVDLAKRSEAQAKKIITTWREAGVLVETSVENKSRHKVKALILDRGKAHAILNDLSTGFDDA